MARNSAGIPMGSGFDWTIPSVVILLTVAIAMAVGCSVMACDSVETESDIRTKYSLLSGCYVEVGGKWVPLDRWRSIAE